MNTCDKHKTERMTLTRDEILVAFTNDVCQWCADKQTLEWRIKYEEAKLRKEKEKNYRLTIALENANVPIPEGCEVWR